MEDASIFRKFLVDEFLNLPIIEKHVLEIMVEQLNIGDSRTYQ